MDDVLLIWPSHLVPVSVAESIEHRLPMQKVRSSKSLMSQTDGIRCLLVEVERVRKGIRLEHRLCNLGDRGTNPSHGYTI